MGQATGIDISKVFKKLFLANLWLKNVHSFSKWFQNFMIDFEPVLADLKLPFLTTTEAWTCPTKDSKKNNRQHYRLSICWYFGWAALYSSSWVIHEFTIFVNPWRGRGEGGEGGCSDDGGELEDQQVSYSKTVASQASAIFYYVTSLNPSSLFEICKFSFFFKSSRLRIDSPLIILSIWDSPCINTSHTS